jgi:hypothetical protein
LSLRGAAATLTIFALNSILALDPFAAREIMVELNPEREDPLLNPWKRGYGVAKRTIRGH